MSPQFNTLYTYRALVFRLLAIFTNKEETIVAMFMTTFEMSFPFDPMELLGTHARDVCKNIFINI